MPRDLVNPLRDLFDAAVRQYATKLACKTCGHTHVFDPHAIWWMFQRAGWSDFLRDVPFRFWCAKCAINRRQKIKYPALELVHEEATGEQPRMPSSEVWKRELRRRR